LARNGRLTGIDVTDEDERAGLTSTIDLYSLLVNFDHDVFNKLSFDCSLLLSN
jgi:hypothetical protein